MLYVSPTWERVAYNMRIYWFIVDQRCHFKYPDGQNIFNFDIIDLQKYPMWMQSGQRSKSRLTTNICLCLPCPCLY